MPQGTYFALVMQALRILIIFAHPRFEESHTHKALLGAVEHGFQVTIHDLYELYPDFNINVAFEKEVLLKHDLIIWQHPLYWYSCPPLLKQWIDMVLEFGWAYGPGGLALEGKFFLQVISSGGNREVYATGGRNRFSLNTFLTPFNQTVHLCKAHYLPPFVVQGTHRLEAAALTEYAQTYASLLNRLKVEIPLQEMKHYEYMNDWLAATSTEKS